ncbi:hypothetical protein [Sphingomonas arenae]|uniref:PAS domain-containing protein n=1 Tax=Sphingomonas arenae TaxID=2812555 RepID=UPI00196714BE|nr:hypothetical protein [Sphingomonas arenae]
MDGYQARYEDPVEEAPPAPPIEIGTDERRMHVRAYNYWASLLKGRDYPSIEDLDPVNIEDFASNSVLLDFTENSENPTTAYIGVAIRAECDIGPEVQTIAQVPSRSLLSRLTDHYLQIIANRAPIGFEAEFQNQRGHEICYRGILMPFSSDGETIDFIYGVINWKDTSVVPRELAPMPAAPRNEAEEPLLLEEAVEGDELLLIEVDEDAGLADRLWAARESAELCKAADGRSRAALYRALALAYDFAVASRRVPDEFAEILDDAGVKAQARAPMTAIVKLVFGIDYDKTRLTEFASALSHAERQGVDIGEFEEFVNAQPGGLKGLVAAERLARRPEPRPDTRLEQGRLRLRNAAPKPLSALAGNDEFSLVLVRRGSDGKVEPVSAVSDLTMLEKAIRKLAA